MTSRVGAKGQVVIPKALRDHLDIKPGDQVTFSLADNAVLVEPVTGRICLDAGAIIAWLENVEPAATRVNDPAKYLSP